MRLRPDAAVVMACLAVFLHGCVAVEGGEAATAAGVAAAAGASESGADLSGAAAARERKNVLLEVGQHVAMHILMHVGEKALTTRPTLGTYTGTWTNTTNYTVHLFLHDGALAVNPGERVTFSGPVEIRQGLRVVSVRGDCNGLLGLGYCYFRNCRPTGPPGLTLRGFRLRE